MARISFTSSMEEIIGKFGGNVFQDSYFGIQLRGLTKPRNPQTQLQQLRRGDFGFLSASWRYLSSSDKNTWITEAGTVPEALRLFLQSNVNLIIAEQNTVNTFVSGPTPVSFPVQINSLSPVQFEIQASGATTTVPTDNQLLIYATQDNKLTNNYINPADYQPIVSYATGTDFSTSHDIILKWFQHYGIMRLNRYICIKAVLINTVNGSRGPENIICSQVNLPATNYLINFDGVYIIDTGGGYIIAT